MTEDEMAGWHHRLNGHGERGEEGEMYGKSNMETYIQFSSVQPLSRVQLFSTP